MKYSLIKIPMISRTYPIFRRELQISCLKYPTPLYIMYTYTLYIGHSIMGNRLPNRLYRLATTQHGYFSAAQAKDIGISTYTLRQHIDLVRVRRTVYRLAQFSSSDHEDMVVVWLWSKRSGIFSHETALMLHNLSDALPSKIHITLPLAWKRQHSKLPTIAVTYYADLTHKDWMWIEHLPTTTPLRTIDDCHDASSSTELIAQAERQLIDRKLQEEGEEKS